MMEKKKPRTSAKKGARRIPPRRSPQRKPARPAPRPQALPAARAPRREPIVITKRQALPWLVSLGFHGLLLLTSLLIVVARMPEPLPAQPIEVALGSGIGVASGDGSIGEDLPQPARARVPVPQRAQLRLPLPARPVAEASARPRVAPLSSASAPQAVSGAPATPPVPSAQQVLADLPSASGAEEASTDYGWESGTSRVVLVRKEPRFPPVLSAEGQEAECVARITVAPAGNVTRVEIVRGSGYTEIDASVEAALREFLFSRVEGRKDAVGTITFRFRLEKRD